MTLAPSFSTAASHRVLLLAGVIGVLGHLLGVAADVASAFPATTDASIAHSLAISVTDVTPLLIYKPHAHLVWGHYLAILGIPLGAFGLWQVCQASRPVGPRWTAAIFAVGVAAYVYGTVVHSTLGFLATALQARAGAPLEATSHMDALVRRMTDFYEPVGLLMVFAMMLVFLALGLPVVRGKTLFSRWMVVWNPLVSQIVFAVLILALSPPLQTLLFVVEFNASAALFYTASTLYLWKHSPAAPATGKGEHARAGGVQLPR